MSNPSKDSQERSAKAPTRREAKSSGPLSSPRRPAPEWPDLLSITSVKEKPRPRREPEPWEEDKDSAAEPHGSIWFDLTWKARSVALSPDRRRASWRNSRYGGFLTSAQHLRKTVYGRFFEVCIEQVDTKWSDGFGIGIGVHPSLSSTLEADIGGFYEGLAWESMPHSWMLGYDGRVKIHRSTRYLTTRETLGSRWRASKLQTPPINAKVDWSNTGDQSPVKVKLIDFDTVETVQPQTPKKAKDVLGTDQYIAQEAYDGNYSAASDIFAVGVIGYRLLTAKFPFRADIFDDEAGDNWVGSPKMKEIRQKLQNYKIDWNHRVFSLEPQACNLIKAMLASNERERPTAKEALANGWFNETGRRRSMPDLDRAGERSPGASAAAPKDMMRMVSGG